MRVKPRGVLTAVILALPSLLFADGPSAISPLQQTPDEPVP
jgi:hypothetical protein